MDQDGVILFIGLVLLALLVLLRNRPLLFLGRLFRGIGRPLGRLFRPIAALLRALRILPRTVSKEARNYVGPSAFSSIIRAFRPKTETERELDKTEFMSLFAAEAKTFAVPKGKTVELEAAAKDFHDRYVKHKTLLDEAFERADGDPRATCMNFNLLRQAFSGDGEKSSSAGGEEKSGEEHDGSGQDKQDPLNLDPKSVKPALEREERHLDRRGWIFKWLEPKAGYIRDEDIDWNGALENYFLSNIFFTYDIPVGTPRSGVKATSLYEDIDGAFSVSMFGIRDRDVYYLFTQMRKVINGNVRRLTVWFSLIAAAFFLLNVYIAGPVPDSLSELMALDSSGTLAGIELPGPTRVLLISFLISAVTMWLLYAAEYRHYVRNNGREMNNFLTRYLARLNNMYRQAERNARGVFAGEIDTSSADAEEHAQVWFANIQWVAFRAFYVETFLRNTLYQIYRNSGYYIFLVPFIFAIGTFLLLFYTNYLSTLAGMLQWSGWPPNAESLHMLLFLTASVLLVLMVAYYLINSLSELEGTIREAEWFNFHHFELQRTTTNLIGRYGNEIRFWRERLKVSQRTSG